MFTTADFGTALTFGTALNRSVYRVFEVIHEISFGIDQCDESVAMTAAGVYARGN